MADRKLTPLQTETLMAVSLGKVVSRNMGYAAYRILGASPTVVGRLVSIGLVRWTDYLGGDARLTDAGEEALRNAEPIHRRDGDEG
jgi:hypothetical protein